MVASSVVDNDAHEISQWVYQEKIKMLYVNHRYSWHLSLLVAALIASFSIQSDQMLVGGLWWLLFILITLLRTRSTQKFCETPSESRDYIKCHKRFFWLAMLAGVTWGVGGLVVGVSLGVADQIIILLILVGVCAAAIPLMGILQDVMLGFQIPAVVPYFGWLAYSMEDKAVILAVVLLAYMAGVILTMKRIAACIVKSLRIQYRMEKMTDFLNESNQELQCENEKLEYMTLEDPLTNLYNRRYFEMHLEKEWRQAVRNKSQLTLIVIDVDFFKLFNDAYGHAEGDVCLKTIAQQLQQSLHRPGDVIARIGGEEFVVLLPEIDVEGALTVAHTMQERMEHAAIVHSASPLSDKVTVSIGIASASPVDGVTALSLFKAADKALYKAKANGRNQLVVGELDVVID